MKTFRIAALALAVAGVFATEAKAGSTTNNWWDVTFDDKLAECIPGDPKWDPMIVLTNRTITNDGVQVSIQTWDTGFWTTLDGDETSVTNEFNPTNTFKQYGDNMCLKLDTQGNDLTWRVDDGNTMADTLTALVDADLYLVGSDSPPDAADFDAANDVQAAVYLKNETNEDTGETTNSVLCVYVFDPDAEDNYWQELKGVKLYDNSWASVKVVVDHARVIDPTYDKPVVQVFVNGVKMTARNGDADHWQAANAGKSQTAGRVSSVAFRGTGAVDNFVGKLVETTRAKSFFMAEVYLDGHVTNELCQVTSTEFDIGGVPPVFEQFLWEEYDDNLGCALYGLDKVEIVDFANNRVQTYQFDYDPVEGTIDPMPEEGNVVFYGAGFFRVTGSTAGAPEPATPDGHVTNVLTRIYFKSAFAYNGYATTTIDGTTTSDAHVVKESDFADEGATKTLTWEFPATKNGNVLSTIQVFNGADLVDYADKTATVSVTLTEALDANTLFAAATYVAGTLADGQDLERTKNGDTYTFAPTTSPVAIIVAGNVTNKYDSLRDAVTNATAGDTIYLLRDDALSFSAESDEMLEIVIDKALTIDGGSHTLFGVSGYSAGGFHDIFVVGSGALTIKDLKFSEFGDTATSFQYETYPIVTSGNYTGQLTLDGVTIDKFARTAVNLNGGTVLITNCTFTADPTAYYQTGVETLNAVVTVVDTIIAGVNSNITGEDPEGAAVFTLKGHDGYTGTGSITVLSGDYTGQFIVAAEALATGSAILSNGTFVATAPASESAFNLDAGTVTVAGGWYDREPEAKYIAAGLSAVDYGNEAPDARATWAVEGEMVTVTWVITEASSNMVRVAKGSSVNAYAGNDLVNEGKTFKFWSTDGTTEVTFPVTADANLTFVAVWDDAAVEPIAVTIGGDTTNPLPGDKEPITVDATDGFTLRFAAKQVGVTYILQSATTVNGTFADVEVGGKAVSVTPEAVDEVVELTDPDTASTVKFFRVKVVVAE